MYCIVPVVHICGFQPLYLEVLHSTLKCEWKNQSSDLQDSRVIVFYCWFHLCFLFPFLNSSIKCSSVLFLPYTFTSELPNRPNIVSSLSVRVSSSTLYSFRIGK